MVDVEDLFDEYEEPADKTQDKNPVAEQRKHIKELEKRLKETEPELERLQKFEQEYKTTQREGTIKSLFSELGVPEHATKFYKLENPEGEVTKEAVAKWAVENQFVSPDQFSDDKTTEGYTPTTRGEGFMPGAKVYSRKEFEKLLSTGDPADLNAANKAVAEGRVDFIREDSK